MIVPKVPLEVDPKLIKMKEIPAHGMKTKLASRKTHATDGIKICVQVTSKIARMISAILAEYALKTNAFLEFRILYCNIMFLGKKLSNNTLILTASRKVYA